MDSINLGYRFTNGFSRTGQIVSVASQKGGVGKTTTAVNLAASLGAIGKKTLLIDLDPQGNATSGLGISKKDLKIGLFDVLDGKADVRDAILPTAFDHLSILPTNTSLARAETRLGDFAGGEYVLKDKLKGIKGDFEYLIIDCPPSLGLLTVNAMAASDGVVIPMPGEFFALEGLSQLMFTINKMKQHYNPSLNVTGILLTMFNPRLKLSAGVIGEIRKHYPDKLFDTTISRNVRISEAPGFGMPVYYYDKNCKGAAEYIKAAKELTERI